MNHRSFLFSLHSDHKKKGNKSQLSKGLGERQKPERSYAKASHEEHVRGHGPEGQAQDRQELERELEGVLENRGKTRSNSN